MNTNERVAVEVMGMQRGTSIVGGVEIPVWGYAPLITELPWYDSDMNDAMLVVEEMRRRNWNVELWLQFDGENRVSVQTRDIGNPITLANVWSESLPEAICLAALAAVGGEKEYA